MPFISSVRGSYGPQNKSGTFIPPSLYSFTSATFTPGGSVGTVGPTISQVRSGISGNTEWKNDTNFLNASGGIITWKVPVDGTYRITCAGAQGGSGKYPSYYGGFGIIMVAEISLSREEILSLVVGQEGGHVSNSAQGSSGGGGGSFVFRSPSTRSTSTVIVAAGGGGGGGGNSAPLNGRNAVPGTSGDTNSSGQSGGVGGAGGPSYGGGGGGAGISTSGANGVDTAAGGIAISSNANGGRGGNCAASQSGSFNYNSLGADQGGFGGGGGGEWCSSGSVGGGGGYSGGAGSSGSSGVGGGGGSFVGNGATLISNNTFNGSTALAERAALDGYITITKL